MAKLLLSACPCELFGAWTAYFLSRLTDRQPEIVVGDE